MRILLALILLLCGSLAQAQEVQRTCENRYVFNHAVATGPVQVVAPVGQQKIYYCGFIVAQAGQTLSFQITAGKGATCQTGTIQLTPVFDTPPDMAMTTRIPSTPPIVGSDGMALCLQTTGTGKLAGIIFFSQF